VSCCPLTAAFLRMIGCPHAAAMHTNAGRAWTPDDYREHFAEERERLFPLYVAQGGGPAVGILLADHDVFEQELRALGRIVSVERWRQHSQLEDRLTSQLVRAHAVPR
jgi:hypothetical protein